MANIIFEIASDGKITIKLDRAICDLCGVCVAVCPENCIELTNENLTILKDECTFCGLCVKACPVAALSLERQNRSNEIDEK